MTIPFPRQRAALKRHGFDAAYLQRLRERDPETEGHFCAYFGELILIKVRARPGLHALAEDVKQETFLRVLQTLRTSGLRDAGSLGSFVNSVCNNVLLELSRSQSRHRVPDEEPAPLPDLATPDAETHLIDEETRWAVRRVIDGLPPRDRRLLRGLFLEEREKSELCQELGVDRDYLRVLLHRAKNQFRMLYVERERTAAVATGSTDDRRRARRSAEC